VIHGLLVVVIGLVVWSLASMLLGPFVGRLLRRNRRAHTTRTPKNPGGSR